MIKAIYPSICSLAVIRANVAATGHVGIALIASKINSTVSEIFLPSSGKVTVIESYTNVYIRLISNCA